MKSFIVGIAGGSGSGKSTVAASLYKKHPNDTALLHLDDYFKRTPNAPREGEFINWDSPEALRFDDLLADLKSLINGKPITILTKSEVYHPAYNPELKNKLEYAIEPKPIIILEGYLVLHDQRIRDLMNLKVFLDIPIEESTKRRSQNKFQLDETYLNQILIPMHQQFVEPTKKYADGVIDVIGKSSMEVEQIVEKMIAHSMKPDISLYEADPARYEQYQALRPDYSKAIETVISMVKKHTHGNLSVADFCCGTGSISKRISLEVSPIEKLDLVDINPSFLEIAKSSGIKSTQIKTYCSDILETSLSKDHNLVLSIFAYHHVENSNKSSYVSKVKQSLLLGGILILAEIFLPTKDDCLLYYQDLYAAIPDQDKSPDLESFLMETAQSKNFEFKVSKEFSDNQFKEAGFELIDEVKIWPSTNDNKGTYVQTYKLIG